ncbi:MAG: RsmD family RNA methyltransferase, partial [Bacteroidia bacterium]|nr:RsmD family RNA methyltransferase [Bacteroidia bacterium]
MRIISGTYKGRRITAPKNLPVRPTTDMAKEALFNILNNHYYFDSIMVLDLFAGTGNISYEFASRGVEKILAVDENYKCIKFINETAESFNMPIST